MCQQWSYVFLAPTHKNSVCLQQIQNKVESVYHQRRSLRHRGGRVQGLPGPIPPKPKKETLAVKSAARPEGWKKFTLGIGLTGIPDNVWGLLLKYSLIARFMGPTWGRQDPGVPHVGPINFAIWVVDYLLSFISVYSHNEA